MCEKAERDPRPFILFADDDPDVLELFVLLAERMGWRVDTAKTAREIIDKVNHHCKDLGQCYDVIVSDVHFFDTGPGPRFTGLTAIGQIRERWPQVPVIFYSAYLDTAMRDEIRALGNAQAVEKLGRAHLGRNEGTDIIGVLERVEQILKWVIPKHEGPDRRTGKTSDTRQRRRATDCEGDVTIPATLESALVEATALRELHLIAGHKE